MICILGNTPLSFYLASKFKDAGKDVFILSAKTDNKKCSVTIKEDGKFQKKQYEIDVVNHLDITPKLLIIASPLCDLTTEITVLRKTHLVGTKILCLSGLQKPDMLIRTLGKDIELGYYDGAFHQKNDVINILGLGVNIYLLPTGFFYEIFKGAEFKIDVAESADALFWKWFSSFAITYLLTCTYKKSVFELSKTKSYRELIEILATEMHQIASSKVSSISITDILSNVSAISNQIIHNFCFHNINFIRQIIEKDKPELNNLIKIIYKNNVI